MLRLVAARGDVGDEALPIEVRELPADLAALDVWSSGPGRLEPFVEHWQREALRPACRRPIMGVRRSRSRPTCG